MRVRLRSKRQKCIKLTNANLDASLYNLYNPEIQAQTRTSSALNPLSKNRNTSGRKKSWMCGLILQIKIRTRVSDECERNVRGSELKKRRHVDERPVSVRFPNGRKIKHQKTSKRTLISINVAVIINRDRQTETELTSCVMDDVARCQGMSPFVAVRNTVCCTCYE